MLELPLFSEMGVTEGGGAGHGRERLGRGEGEASAAIYGQALT